MKSKEVLNLLKITRPTLTKYVKDGLVTVDATINGRYVYNDASVFTLVGRKAKKRGQEVVSYSRVSTKAQEQQLHEQTKRIYDSCVARGIVLSRQVEEIASGMNNGRVKFQALVRDVINGNVGVLVVENRDRLIRFNFELLEQIFMYYGTKILVLNDVLENKTYEQELTEDLISIIHYFTMKSYSHRRKLNRLRRELENKELDEETI